MLLRKPSSFLSGLRLDSKGTDAALYLNSVPGVPDVPSASRTVHNTEDNSATSLLLPTVIGMNEGMNERMRELRGMILLTINDVTNVNKHVCKDCKRRSSRTGSSLFWRWVLGFGPFRQFARAGGDVKGLERCTPFGRFGVSFGCPLRGEEVLYARDYFKT